MAAGALSLGLSLFSTMQQQEQGIAPEVSRHIGVEHVMKSASEAVQQMAAATASTTSTTTGEVMDAAALAVTTSNAEATEADYTGSVMLPSVRNQIASSISIMSSSSASQEWIEGVAILATVAVVVGVSSATNYQKEVKFRQLNSVKEDTQVGDTQVGDTQVGDT
jgi:hypothetical protein